MPIWMQVISPTGYKIHYPSSATPNDFYCNEVEVKQDGRLLRPLIGLPAEGRGGAACGWLGIADIAESKLPIHLEYLLTEPGTYMVRFTRREYRLAKPSREIAEQSDWTPLYLQVAPPGMIEHWLTNQLSDLPGIPGRLLGDALPSLLASRDRRVLQLMIETSYDADPAVAAYAANSLELFDPEQVRTQLLSVLRERGPNDALGYPHIDEGRYYASRDRYHLVVQTSEGASKLICGPEIVQMGLGEVWWLNNKALHSSENNSSTDRVHVIFDLAPGK